MTTAKVTEQAEASAEKTPKMKVCHTSVCVGNAQPINCVCPVTPKK